MTFVTGSTPSYTGHNEGRGCPRISCTTTLGTRSAGTGRPPSSAPAELPNPRQALEMVWAGPQTPPAVAPRREPAARPGRGCMARRITLRLSTSRVVLRRPGALSFAGANAAPVRIRRQGPPHAVRSRIRHNGAMAESLRISEAVYLGGFGHLEVNEPRWGTLILSDESITLTRVQNQNKRRYPDIEMCRTRAIASIEVTSEQVAKSKVGATLLFGVFGGLAAKGAADRSTLIVSLLSGSAGYFIVKKYFAAQLLGIADPWRREMGIGLGEAPETVAAPPLSVADEIAKLAQQRDFGALTEDESVLLKTQLIKAQTTQRRRPNSRNPVSPSRWSGQAQTCHHWSPRGENHRPVKDGTSRQWVLCRFRSYTMAQQRSTSAMKLGERSPGRGGTDRSSQPVARATPCNSDVGNRVARCRDVSPSTAIEQVRSESAQARGVPVPY